MNLQPGSTARLITQEELDFRKYKEIRLLDSSKPKIGDIVIREKCGRETLLSRDTYDRYFLTEDLFMEREMSEKFNVIGKFNQKSFERLERMLNPDDVVVDDQIVAREHGVKFVIDRTNPYVTVVSGRIDIFREKFIEREDQISWDEGVKLCKMRLIKELVKITEHQLSVLKETIKDGEIDAKK